MRTLNLRDLSDETLHKMARDIQATAKTEYPVALSTYQKQGTDIWVAIADTQTTLRALNAIARDQEKFRARIEKKLRPIWRELQRRDNERRAAFH